jgi:hypothetical protein
MINRKVNTIAGDFKNFCPVGGAGKLSITVGFCSKGIIFPSLLITVSDNSFFNSIGRNILSLKMAFLSLVDPIIRSTPNVSHG